MTVSDPLRPREAALPRRALGRALVWLRRDLRLPDHAALHRALRAAREVWPVFLFDREILDPLPRRDRRVEFIWRSLQALDAELRALGEAHGRPGTGLITRHGRALEELPRLALQLGVDAVFTNLDPEPAAQRRDAAVAEALRTVGIAFHGFKDQSIFEGPEVLTGAGKPYGVFTPYKNAWLKALTPYQLKAYPVEAHGDALAARPAGEPGVPDTLAAIGFEPSDLDLRALPTGRPGAEALLADFLDGRIDRYDAARDFPAVKGPSYLSVHLRFGTVSIRRLLREAQARVEAGGPGAAGAEVWRSELIWRDFYMQVLQHHPRVERAAFRPEYDRITWDEGPEADAHFEAWCAGRTGYPLVDAAMRQLAQTGYMHNRLRMVVASFLTKDLGLDWRRGEAWFALQLNDFDLAANNGGWQWAASSGCDAQPYFRIFNPVSQSEKFDPAGKFIRRYVPELAALPDGAIHAPWLARPVDQAAAGFVLGRDYPRPIVDHAEARARTLERYAVVKG